MPHILVAGKLHPAGIERLKAAADASFTVVEEVSLESYLPHVAVADAVVLRTQPMTAEVIAAAPKLKIVSRHGVGYDAVDVKALNARGIPLAIVGDVNSRAVAEHTLMLMLAVARQAARHDAAIRQGDWNVRNRFETVELDGKSLLLAGFGRIGRRVAELAQAFGMTVAAYDPFVKPEAMAQARRQARRRSRQGAGRGRLRLAPHAGLRHRRGDLRGGTPGHEARRHPHQRRPRRPRRRGPARPRPREGRLGGAGLDVLKSEPPAPDHPLLTNDRVLLSPHSAGLTAECAARMAVASVQNVLDHFAGKLDPALVVNAAEIGYRR